MKLLKVKGIASANPLPAVGPEPVVTSTATRKSLAFDVVIVGSPQAATFGTEAFGSNGLNIHTRFSRWAARSPRHASRRKVDNVSLRPPLLFGLRELDHPGVIAVFSLIILVGQPLVITFDFVLLDFVGRERNIIQHIRVEEYRLVIALMWQPDHV